MDIKIEKSITYYGSVPMPQVTPASTPGAWRLIEPYHVTIGLDDGNVYVFWIKAGFEFDGASIPRALWRLCGHPMEAPRIAAALIHDWLYRAQLTNRETADDIFNALCKEVGMPWWRTGPEWAALRAFGWAAWNENHEWPRLAQARKMGVLEMEVKS